MKRLILATAIIGALGLPSPTLAQSAAPATGPMVCMIAKAGETPNATIGKSQLVCHSVDMAKVETAMKDVHSMMVEHGATAAEMKQMQAVMMQLLSTFQLPKIPGYFPSDNSER